MKDFLIACVLTLLGLAAALLLAGSPAHARPGDAQADGAARAIAASASASGGTALDGARLGCRHKICHKA